MPATFRFYLREDRPNPKGECPVYLRITHHRKKKYLNTGIRISGKKRKDGKYKYWNEEKERVRRSHKNYSKLNEDLEIIEEDARQARRELSRQKKVSAAAIKSRINGASRENFFTLADDYKARLKADGKFWTRKQTRVALKKLEKFNGSKNLLFTEIDAEFLTRFQSYLSNKYGNKASTIRKNIGAIRKIVKLAQKQHLISSDPFEEVELVNDTKPSYKPKLSYEQIQEIENLDLPKETNRWHARNAFVLSFYFCGMRFGDLASLKWENVSGGRLHYRMNKTDVEINVKLLDEAGPFLDYYDSPDKKETDFILPFLSGLNGKQSSDPGAMRSKISSWNALVNDELKKVAKAADIDENISMHVARHSFAQYGVDRDLSTYKMMMLLGHQSVKTTENYLKTIDVQTADNAIDEIF